MTGRLRPLVLVLHGTNHPAGQRVAHRLTAAVAARLPHVPVRLGWADVLEPPLVDTLRETGPCVVVPVFLAAGYHVRHDLPAAVRASGDLAHLTPHVGTDVLPAVAARLAEAGGADAVVLGAAGSRRRESLAEVAEAARRLQGWLAVPVSPGYVTCGPSVGDVVARFRAQGARRVAVASYFIAPGVLPDRLAGAGADAVAAPIGAHPRLVDLVAARYLRASGGCGPLRRRRGNSRGSARPWRSSGWQR